MKKMFQVFVSSTYKDLKEERNEVMKALLELGCFPAGMEYFPAADEDQWSYIQKLILSCDYYIAIIAGKYGTELADGTSYTEREYRFAIDNNIPVIAFIHHDIDELKADKIEKNPEKLDKLKQFSDLAKKRLCKTWRDKSELGGAVSRSITVLIESKPRTGWIKGDTRTEEHSNLAIEYTLLENKYKELKDETIRAPKFYENFDYVTPILNEILSSSIKDEVYKSEILKIRILGVCCHKSLPILKSFLEKNCNSSKRIEVRISVLDRDSEIMNVLNDIWNNYFDVYEKELDDLVTKLNKSNSTNISIKVCKYKHMPNWHGILINKKHLFLSACVWNSDQSMTAGENHYAYYKKGSSWLHDQKIIQFKRWFDYARYNGEVKQGDQLIYEGQTKVN